MNKRDSEPGSSQELSVLALLPASKTVGMLSRVLTQPQAPIKTKRATINSNRPFILYYHHPLRAYPHISSFSVTGLTPKVSYGPGEKDTRANLREA